MRRNFYQILSNEITLKILRSLRLKSDELRLKLHNNLRIPIQDYTLNIQISKFSLKINELIISSFPQSLPSTLELQMDENNIRDVVLSSIPIFLSFFFNNLKVPGDKSHKSILIRKKGRVRDS